MSRVTVEVNVVNGKIEVEQTLDLRSKPNNVRIFWTLGTTDWNFDDKGIDIVEITNQFRDAKRINGGQAYRWKDMNSDGKTYKYDINLVAADGSGRKLALDPVIVNGGGGGDMDGGKSGA
ncbi:hypothetical protein [Caldimonas sp. KR1-144]|uniref:hypothetical protein n=1 Tax=Caldimonas sp. KR1-144 TaxID=3400911 RepID=UPI003C0357D7